MRTRRLMANGDRAPGPHKAAVLPSGGLALRCQRRSLRAVRWCRPEQGPQGRCQQLCRKRAKRMSAGKSSADQLCRSKAQKRLRGSPGKLARARHPLRIEAFLPVLFMGLRVGLRPASRPLPQRQSGLSGVRVVPCILCILKVATAKIQEYGNHELCRQI